MTQQLNLFQQGEDLPLFQTAKPRSYGEIKPIVGHHGKPIRCTPVGNSVDPLPSVWYNGSMRGGEDMGNYSIDREKLAEVVRLFNDQVDPKATDDLVEREITADWNEGDEHQEWIDNAPVQEIVDWLASFYE